MKYPAEELARGLSNWASDRQNQVALRRVGKNGNWGKCHARDASSWLLKLGRQLTDG